MTAGGQHLQDGVQTWRSDVAETVEAVSKRDGERRDGHRVSHDSAQ
jgi:hypothetical protein